jgi:hypothetical protein
MYLWVKGLYTTIANLGEACDIADANGLNTTFVEEPLCTSCGNNLPTETTKSHAKIYNTGFIANAY